MAMTAVMAMTTVMAICVVVLLLLGGFMVGWERSHGGPRICAEAAEGVLWIWVVFACESGDSPERRKELEKQARKGGADKEAARKRKGRQRRTSDRETRESK